MTSNIFISIVLLVFCVKTSVFAQKKVETNYFKADGNAAKSKAEASYYLVVQTSGKHRNVVKYDSVDVKLEEISYRKAKPPSGIGDSVWWRYGSFKEWFPSGQLKAEGSCVFDLLHDNLKTYYPNGVLRRNDTYYIDTLRTGHCYAQDSSEITHFPYFQKPEFEGGERTLFQYLANNVTYPAEARESNVQGIVYVSFVIGKTGAVENVKIKSGVSKLLDDESMRVVKRMPKWKAGKQDGELVRVNYTLPISFKME